MKKKRVYLSAPISGYDLEERRETFMKMEVNLRGRGYDTFNPMGDHWKEGVTTYDYMKKDLKELLECDAILLMEGWQRSAGCKCELEVAVSIGIDVWFEGMETVTL